MSQWLDGVFTTSSQQISFAVAVSKSYDFRKSLTWLHILGVLYEMYYYVTASVKHHMTVGGVFYISGTSDIEA